MRGAASWLTAMRRAASWLTAVRRAASWLTAVRGAAQVRPCAVRRTASLRRAASWLKSVRRCGVTCESIRARHTVAPYWLTLVRRARHSRTHAPCAQPRASCAHDCHVMRHITYHLVLATLVLHHARVVKNTKAALKRLIAHALQPLCSATLRLIAHATRARERVRVRVRVLRTLREDSSVCFHETMRMKSSTLNTHLSSISPPMWDKVLPSL
ncbi:hypothetical protein Hanom_Chr09g00867871 [Helianthus anomalus]